VTTEVLRYSAFVDDDLAPTGGNPAGVVLDAVGLTEEHMRAIAVDVGYSETAFVLGRTEDDAVPIRYFSPIAEVPFCGHATIATAVAMAERTGPGPILFRTPVGDVDIDAVADELGGISAAFTSIEPVVTELDPWVLGHTLDLLGLDITDLADDCPPRLSHAGNPHPILIVGDRERFDTFTFDPAAMRALMDRQGWTGTVTVMFRESSTVLQARNLFPVGVITEDPATGSAAASAGGYLRAIGRVDPPADLLIRQGRHVGRPSLLRVHVPAAGGITVSGAAVRIPEDAR
jgi:PhzF family phenazine biosynthesis protein